MRAHALVAEVTEDSEVWAEAFEQLYPGAFAVVIARRNADVVAVSMRKAGFVFRDTLMVESGSPTLSVVPCLIFRKPLEEKTLAEQILKTGTGAMNIDATRVKHASKADFEAHKAMVEAVKAKGGVRDGSWKNSSDLSGANDVKVGGRWPGNVVLVHAPGCRRVGETKVDAPVINRFSDGMKPFGNGAGHSFTSEQQGDAEGKETVAVYACTNSCPIGFLDGQSGVTTSCVGQAHVHQTTDNAIVTFNGNMWSIPGQNQHGDTGGASRYFSQFESEDHEHSSLRDWLISLVLPPGGTLFAPQATQE